MTTHAATHLLLEHKTDRRPLITQAAAVALAITATLMVATLAYGVAIGATLSIVALAVEAFVIFVGLASAQVVWLFWNGDI